MAHLRERFKVWIIQQSLILELVLIECGDIIKNEFVVLAREAARAETLWSETESSAASALLYCLHLRGERGGEGPL